MSAEMPNPIALERLHLMSYEDVCALMEQNPRWDKENSCLLDEIGTIRYQIRKIEKDNNEVGIEINRQFQSQSGMWFTTIGIESIKGVGEDGVVSSQLTVKATALHDVIITQARYSDVENGEIQCDDTGIVFSPVSCSVEELRQEMINSGIQDVGKLPDQIDVHATAKQFVGNLVKNNFDHIPLEKPSTPQQV